MSQGKSAVAAAVAAAAAANGTITGSCDNLSWQLSVNGMAPAGEPQPNDPDRDLDLDPDLDLDLDPHSHSNTDRSLVGTLPTDTVALAPLLSPPVVHTVPQCRSNGSLRHPLSMIRRLQNRRVPGPGCGDEELRYGWGTFRPRCLQFLLDRRIFLAVFIVSCVLQGMHFTYLVSVLSTIEKLFGFQLKTIAFVFSATEVGQIGGSLLVSYYGGRGHRPRWIAVGTLVFAACVLLCAVPHFLYGAAGATAAGDGAGDGGGGTAAAAAAATAVGGGGRGLLDSGVMDGGDRWSRDVTEVTDLLSAAAAVAAAAESDAGSQLQLAAAGSNSEQLSIGRSPLCLSNQSVSSTSRSYSAQTDSGSCETGASVGRLGRRQMAVLSFMFIGLLGVGVGQTITSTLGIAHMDDSVTSSESPVYFACVIGLRIFGPVFGFLLGYQCVSVYVYPGRQGALTTADPGWIGAWWLGMLIVSLLMMLDSIVIFGYPRNLVKKCKNDQPVIATSPATITASPANHQPAVEPVSESVARHTGLLGFARAVRALLQNDVLVFRSVSSVLHILPIAGLYTFLPKYLETQFAITPGLASIVSGVAGILVMFPVIMLSGFVIKHVQPSLAALSRWTAVCAFIYASGMFLLMFIGCSQSPVHGVSAVDSPLTAGGATANSVRNDSACWRQCRCHGDEPLAPVCVAGQVTFRSPCYAGCTSRTSPHTYEACSCAGLANGTAISGACRHDCHTFYWFVPVFVVFVVVHASCEVGAMLVTLRCVQADQKPLALGLIALAVSVFASIPCPLLYGAAIDFTCLHWQSVCGERGSCLLYDLTLFRRYFFGLTGVTMLLACVADCVVWRKSAHLHPHPHLQQQQQQQQLQKQQQQQPILVETAVAAVEAATPAAAAVSPLAAPAAAAAADDDCQL